MVVLSAEKECAESRYGGMTALLKPTELVRVISSQLKARSFAKYAASILKHMWVPVCQCMGKFSMAQRCAMLLTLFFLRYSRWRMAWLWERLASCWNLPSAYRACRGAKGG
jgi:hypothetical protein